MSTRKMIVSLLILGSALGSLEAGSKAFADEVVVMACIRGGAETGFKIDRVISSSGVINKPSDGDSCAQSLANLLSCPDNLVIKDVQPYSGVSSTSTSLVGSIYTLTTHSRSQHDDHRCNVEAERHRH
jgi:hypothetical protein